MLNRTISNDDLWNTFVVRLWLKLWENHGKLHTNLIFCVWNFKCKSSGAHSLRDARRLDCLYGFKTKINWNIGRIECIEQYIYCLYKFIRQQPGMVIEKSTHAIQNMFQMTIKRTRPRATTKKCLYTCYWHTGTQYTLCHTHKQTRNIYTIKKK